MCKYLHLQASCTCSIKIYATEVHFCFVFYFLFQMWAPQGAADFVLDCSFDLIRLCQQQWEGLVCRNIIKSHSWPNGFSQPVWSSSSGDASTDLSCPMLKRWCMLFRQARILAVCGESSHTLIHTCTHMYIHTHVHAHTYAHTHAHTCTHTHSLTHSHFFWDCCCD